MKRAAKPLGASAAVKYDVVLYFLAAEPQEDWEQVKLKSLVASSLASRGGYASKKIRTFSITSSMRVYRTEFQDLIRAILSSQT